MEKYELLFESVFKKDIAAAGDAGFLEKIIADYPYFSTAHFYLLQSLQKDSSAYKKQIKKTAVIFNNNYWLNFQLLEAGRLHTTTVDQQTFAIEEDESLSNTNQLTQEKDPVTQNTRHETDVGPTQAYETATAETDVAHDDTNIAATEITADEKPYPDELALPEESKDEVINAEAEQERLAVETPAIRGSISPESPAEIKEEETPADKPAPAGELLFEPLHTTDYFASVGIKLNEEAKPTDRLGKQLKSFTEWLRTMKKIHPDQSGTTTTTPGQEIDTTETKIQQLAEQSNIENEVVTEAMADVLLRQGNKNKAVLLLEKLSLLNPSKSAYFAAKIKQIKES